MILVLYLGSPYFDFLIGLAIIIVTSEVFFSTNRHLGWTLFSAIYIAFSGYALITLRGDTETGFSTVCWLFILVWSADVGAYIFGLIFGGPKFAPRVSPKKTWSGFCGALVLSGISGLIAAYLMNIPAIWTLTALSSILGAISQYGDLLESWLKRRFDKKDMSNLIPGHGGLSDRVDGLAAAAICAWVLNEILPEPLLKWL